MRRFSTAVVAVAVAAASVRCGSSSPAGPAPSGVRRTAAQERAALLQAIRSAVSARANSTAVIGGFRVHPDPAGDGLVHVVEGDGVVVNAADIASRPPAPVTFLIVNWGDSGNDRIACGPCRLTHAFKPGRYTVVATTDDLQPGTVTTSATFMVDVAPRVTPRQSPFKGVAFRPTTLSVGESGVFFAPVDDPFGVPGIVVDDLIETCSTDPGPLPFSIDADYEGPDGFYEAITALVPATCRLEIFSHDQDGNSWHDGTYLYINP